MQKEAASGGRSPFRAGAKKSNWNPRETCALHLLCARRRNQAREPRRRETRPPAPVRDCARKKGSAAAGLAEGRPERKGTKRDEGTMAGRRQTQASRGRGVERGEGRPMPEDTAAHALCACGS